LASSTAKTSNSSSRGQWRVRTLCAGALALVLIALGGLATAQTQEDEQRALARAKAQSILAEQRAEQLEKVASEQRSSAEAAKARAAAVAARVQAAEADISAAESRIVLIDRQRAQLRAELAAKQEPAMRLLAALQSLARRPPALALVQPGSVSDLVHVRAVLAALIPRIRARTADLRKAIDRSKALRGDANRALAALGVAKDRLSAERASLEQMAAERKAIADQTTGSALGEQDRAMALGEKARDIVDLMEKIDEDGAVRSRLARLPGPLLRPAQPGADGPAPAAAAPELAASIAYRIPVTGSVVIGLGEVSNFGVRSRGVTLSTRPNAQIVAPSSGQIVFAGKFGSYDHVVIIDHGQGWSSVITNIAVLDVAAGDSVIQGSPIGRAAEERPTVTVELRQKNKPVDITRLLG
jgi:murein hydrolase activator